MDSLLRHLAWLDDQANTMEDKLIEWASINSGSDNPEGLERMLTTLRRDFAPLGADEEILSFPWIDSIDASGNKVTLPVGKAYHLTKHESAPVQILLVGHMDTVFSKMSSFQEVERLEDGRLQGPGVTDAKGGLMVLLKALEALEKSPMAGKVGWEVFISGNEETGSVGSGKWLAEHATGKSFGLVFEPSHSDSSFVHQRPGSINIIIKALGKAAHAGRDPGAGKNAIVALACLALAIDEIGDEETLVNIGQFHGGVALNVVPDRAVCKINIRAKTDYALKEAQKIVDSQTLEIEKTGVVIEKYLLSLRPPKPFDEKTKQLFNDLKECCTELGETMTLKESGGVCDGNELAAAGLPTIDTMGPVGGQIHTDQEWVDLKSLVTRAKLAALLMMKAAVKN